MSPMPYAVTVQLSVKSLYPKVIFLSCTWTVVFSHRKINCAAQRFSAQQTVQILYIQKGKGVIQWTLFWLVGGPWHHYDRHYCTIYVREITILAKNYTWKLSPFVITLNQGYNLIAKCTLMQSFNVTLKTMLPLKSMETHVPKSLWCV